MHPLLPIQLPDDVVSVGYRQARPFHYEQVFYSASNGFTGTEKEFYRAGLAYQYRQLNPYTRVCYKAN